MRLAGSMPSRRPRLNVSPADAWQESSIDLKEYPDLLGQTVRVAFRGVTDFSNPTTFYIDVVSLDQPYHVFVQPYGDAELCVSERTATHFTVRRRAGDARVESSYRIVARRRGYETTRLEPSSRPSALSDAAGPDAAPQASAALTPPFVPVAASHTGHMTSAVNGLTWETDTRNLDVKGRMESLSLMSSACAMEGPAQCDGGNTLGGR